MLSIVLSIVLGKPVAAGFHRGALTYLPLDHWLWLAPAFVFGAAIGSFLNVVIYRVPRGLSVNKPKRSFCPQCEKPIPARLNVPLLSWLWLRGKCRECGAPIAFRYFGVELLTALWFTAVWWCFAPVAPLAAILLLCAAAALWVAITFIDLEHMFIPAGLTASGTILGLLACALWPQLPVLAGEAGPWWHGLLKGGLGWVCGFVGLSAVVEFGKLAFGRKKLTFPEPAAWSLREPTRDDEPLCFLIGDETLSWWDLFYRKSDRLLVETTAIRVDGESRGDGLLTLRETEIHLPDGTVIPLAKLKSLDGTATRVVIPREAMGAGDVHLLGMIGAFFGWSGAVFALMAASLVALAAALVARIGFGKPVPFGPFLVVGAAGWMFGGWRLFAWYVEYLSPLFELYQP